ncbi:phage integrase family protein [Pigmentiphaga litoralis]|uniref:phage integrase family protein n=1 Tax=Pigmentiphaga litoralis TaxID=516702 RepID=UPI003899CFD8
MAQNNDVAAEVRNYTRLDFTALRYRFNKIPISVIRDRLYTEDVLEARGIATESQLASWLDDLRDNLIERARKANPLISKNLEDARTLNSWPAGTINFLVLAGEKSQAAPQPSDSLGVWLRPRVSKVLSAEGIGTIEDLKACIELRGDGWYRPIPRIGRGKALALERWLGKNVLSVGTYRKPVDSQVVASKLQIGEGDVVRLLPIERIANVAAQLDGRHGKNRARGFSLIAARNDLEAIQSYLYKFRGRDRTLRSYRKELERFLLWCVGVRRCALSSVLLDECEAYKDFLARPAADWIGKKAPRASPRWRPFERMLSPESQRYAVQVLRGFFDWLVKVRYLGGNPWVTVSDPPVIAKESLIDIEKALPEELWQSLVGDSGILSRAADEAQTPQDKVQYRLARAIIELLGSTGIRREEAAGATRGYLNQVRDVKAHANKPGLWELRVLGKRSRWRTVFLPSSVVALIAAHWADRGHDFDDLASKEMALISPVVVPSTESARAKHLTCNGELTGNGFSPEGLYRIIKSTLTRLAIDQAVRLSDTDRQILLSTAPHAFRHTFATRATAGQVPIDVVQRTLGHVSQQTTSIYVRAERTRSIEELGAFFDAQK